MVVQLGGEGSGRRKPRSESRGCASMEKVANAGSYRGIEGVRLGGEGRDRRGFRLVVREEGKE